MCLLHEVLLEVTRLFVTGVARASRPVGAQGHLLAWTCALGVGFAAAACSCGNAGGDVATTGSRGASSSPGAAGSTGAGTASDTPRCVGAWPKQAPDSALVPSRSVKAPKVLWRRHVSSTAYRPGLAVAAGRVALVAGNALFLLDARQGRLVASVVDDSALAALAPPVADANGTFYFAGARVFSVGKDGAVRWYKKIESIEGAAGETASTSALLLGPGEVLYFAATDGKLHAVRTTDGQDLWLREVGLSKGGGARWLGAGVGDTLYVEGVPHDAATGAPSRTPLVGGEPVLVELASASGLLLAGRPWTKDRDPARPDAIALDRCGTVRWSPRIPGRWAFALVGPGDTVLVRGIDPRGKSVAYLYSSSGEPVAGPAEVRGAPNLFGRDGTLYAVECEGGTSGAMRLRAYGRDLALLWDLDLGPSCSWQGAVLDDRGVLFVARARGAGKEPGAEVVAVQTESPGPLESSWPAWRHDVRGTGWLMEKRASVSR